MEQWIGAISAREEFFYPDTPLCALPDSLSLAAPGNGRPGVQLLVKTDAKALCARLQSEQYDAEFFCMKAIPVEYNTGDGEDQGGAMVLEQRPAQKPWYATRLAPFAVYDCLKPSPDGRIETENGVAALYVCLVPKPGAPAGECAAVLSLGGYSCTLRIRRYGVTIPQDTFPVTNWFSVEAICRMHHVASGTPEFYDMARRYARAMRRAHQNIFYIELDSSCIVCREPWTFCFDAWKPLIQCFFDEGMQRMELGGPSASPASGTWRRASSAGR